MMHPLIQVIAVGRTLVNSNVIGVHFAGSLVAKNARNYAVSSKVSSSFFPASQDIRFCETSGGGSFSDVLKE